MAESVTVGVRIRPLNSRELSGKNASVAWRGDSEESSVFRTDGNVSQSSAFRFDSVFTAQSTNETVYTDLAAPVVEAALGGFNATMFAYGQTSSGKTHSMLGEKSDPGITPRAIRHVLQSANSSRTREFLVRAVYVEIYNDRIRDLSSPTSSDLMVREDAAGRTFVDACETVVHTFEDAMGVLEKGQLARHVGETKMNARSSRSHTVFTLLIESKPKAIPDDDGDDGGSGGVTTSKGDGGEQKAFRASSLNLVDLAGSERVKSTGATGKRQVEGAKINQSLLVLGTIINRLSAAANGAKQVGHLPYRDSKLTRLLRPALGGNARTAILCAITPAAAHAEETLSTLKFAERAKKVTNHARRNEIVDYRAKYKQAATEVTVLRERLAAMELELDAVKAEGVATDGDRGCKMCEAGGIGNGQQGVLVQGGKEATVEQEDAKKNAVVVTPIDTSVVTSASSSPLSTPSVPAEAYPSAVGDAPTLEVRDSGESNSSSGTTMTTSSSLSTASSFITSHDSSQLGTSFPSSSSGSSNSTSMAPPFPFVTSSPPSQPGISRKGSLPIGDGRARKLFSDTDAAVKREVELRAARDEARFLKAVADEAEGENEILRERLRTKAKEFTGLRMRAVELRSMARETRSHERALLRLVRVSFEQLEDARSQLDASRKKGSHVLLAEDRLTLLSQSLARYAKLGEEALKQDARAKHERAVVVRPKGTVSSAKNLNSDNGKPGASVDNVTKAEDLDKAAALALRLGGIDEDVAAAFSVGGVPTGKRKPVVPGKENRSKEQDRERNNSKASGRAVRRTGTGDSLSQQSSSHSSWGGDRKRRPRPLPEDMVADIDDDPIDTGTSKDRTRDREQQLEEDGPNLSARPSDWAEIDAELEDDDNDDGDQQQKAANGVKKEENGEGGEKEKETEQGQKGGSRNRWQPLRSFYGYGQHGHGVYDVVVGGHKVDGKSSTGLAR